MAETTLSILSLILFHVALFSGILQWQKERSLTWRPTRRRQEWTP
jgi:hypothetical protein